MRNALLGGIVALGAALALSAALGMAVPSASAAEKANAADPIAKLDAARALLSAHFGQIQKRSGMAADLQERLDTETGQMLGHQHSSWMSESEYADYVRDTATLESSLIQQLATGRYHDLASVRGEDDIPYRTPADGTMQPMAVYVPPTYDPHRPSALVVFLHGRTWTENDILVAQPVIRQDAAASNAIVIAPYGRGDNQYADPASVDVYAALDVAEHAFNVDCNRVYLGGHSMGGYGVFVVGPKHPHKWAGIFAAAGAMNNKTPDAVDAFSDVPVYVVWGSNDDYAQPGYFQKVVDTLNAGHVDAHAYEENGGRHAINSIRSSFDKAWRAMLANSRHPGSGC
ncbi:MAG: prolyl oligopeptidase family serine peptidase [Candidatus Eremiobacteraeota bacterium]|nr:prolyl oligopeptidase family serine peptidase [Candidatus Eremiobacteraeota bacterium]MBC5826644.1 prolyl oligopeptidase family serine peptidase [Candidatus Eremiobacteraeota bacterium]